MPRPRPSHAETSGEVIERHVRNYRVGRWLAGSTDRGDRPTLAELAASGYVVMDRATAELLADLAQDDADDDEADRA